VPWIVLASVVVAALLCAAVACNGERRAYRRQLRLAAQQELEEARAHRRCLDEIAAVRDRTAHELARIAAEPSDEIRSIAELFRCFLEEGRGR
jgi:hypothetical protein